MTGDRMERKRLIVLLLSDLGVLGKVKHGRADELTDMPALPDFWTAASANRWGLQKGSKEWRQCREFALTGKLPAQKKQKKEEQKPE